MSKLSRRGRRSRLRVERLENRLMLAGNVTASVVRGDLVIEGDDLGNGIDVTQAADGAYVVEGLWQSGADTTVNGEASVELTGVKDDIRIYMKGGDDHVHLTGSFGAPLSERDGPPSGPLVVPDDLLVFTHAGDDTVALQMANVGDDARFYTMDGNDRVEIWDAEIGDDLSIHTHGGGDQVSVESTGVGDDLGIHTHGGGDYVGLYDTGVGDDTKIATGSGSDSVEVVYSHLGDDLRAYMGSSDDFLGIGWSDVGDDAYLYSHGGADEILLTGTTVKDNLHVNSGSGNDNVGFGPLDCPAYGNEPEAEGRSEVNDTHFGVTAKDGKVFTGSGDDVLAIAICTFNDDLHVYLGSGNDAAGIAGTTVKDRFYLYGGSGSDQVVIAPNAGHYIEPDNFYLQLIWACAEPDFGLTAKYATIMTQSGNDSVVLNDLVIEKYLKVYLSSGKDDLSVKNTTVKKKAYFNGGSGKDAIHRCNNDFKRVSVRRFEIKDDNVL